MWLRWIWGICVDGVLDGCAQCSSVEEKAEKDGPGQLPSSLLSIDRLPVPSSVPSPPPAPPALITLLLSPPRTILARLNPLPSDTVPSLSFSHPHPLPSFPMAPIPPDGIDKNALRVLITGFGVSPSTPHPHHPCGIECPFIPSHSANTPRTPHGSPSSLSTTPSSTPNLPQNSCQPIRLP